MRGSGQRVADLLDPGSAGALGPPTLRAVALGASGGGRHPGSRRVTRPRPGRCWLEVAGGTRSVAGGCARRRRWPRAWRPGWWSTTSRRRGCGTFVDDVVDARVAAGLVDPDLPIHLDRGHLRSARGHAVGRPCDRPGRGERPDRPGAQPAGPRSADQPRRPGRVVAGAAGDPDRRADHPAAVGQRGPGPVRRPARGLGAVGRHRGDACCAGRGAPGCPSCVEELGGGSVVGLADADVLEFVDQVAPRLQAAGFDVIAPGGLLRPSPVRRRLASAGSGTGALGVDGLGLEAEVLVDGERADRGGPRRPGGVEVRARVGARALAADRAAGRPAPGGAGPTAAPAGDPRRPAGRRGLRGHRARRRPGPARRPAPGAPDARPRRRPGHAAPLPAGGPGLADLAGRQPGRRDPGRRHGAGQDPAGADLDPGRPPGPDAGRLPGDPGGHLGAPGRPVHPGAAGAHLPRRRPRIAWPRRPPTPTSS